MPSSRSLVASLAALACLGCASASGRFTPLAADHPASPDATELPVHDPSAFLLEGAAPATPAEAEPARAPTGAFVCPMHPGVTSDVAGRCPECGMQLVPREKSEEHPHDG